MKALILGIALLLPIVAWANVGHHEWDALLKRHIVAVDGGNASRVDYAGFARERALLHRYLHTLSRVEAKAFEDWPKADRLAFLINAYNAFTVELVLSADRRVQSIKELGTFLRSPWQRKFFVLLGKKRSLDDIEHRLIRADGVYDEPRIHFAVNCASIGCPALRAEAYNAQRLEQQLEDATRQFLSDRSRNRYDPDANRLYVSKIFDWYEADFTRGWRGYRSVNQFLADYAEQLTDNAEQRRIVAAGRADVRFLDYDWALNGVLK